MLTPFAISAPRETGRRMTRRPFKKRLTGGGGVVYAPRGNYFFAGHLSVPDAVALKGMWESVPSHIGIRNAGAAKPTDDGTTFLVTESRGKEDGPPFITLNTDS